MRRFYTCDESFERNGPERCCLFTAGEIDAMKEPDDGSLRCETHGQLVGLQRPIMAWDLVDARTKLLRGGR